MSSYLEPVPAIPSLPPLNIFDDDTQPMEEQLDSMYTMTADVVNDKARAELYLLQEDITNDTWVSSTPEDISDPIFRNVIATGVLAAGANVIAHGITNFDTLVNIRVMVTNGSNQRLIPYANPTAANSAAVDVDATNVTITLGAGFGANYEGYIIMQYTRS